NTGEEGEADVSLWQEISFVCLRTASVVSSRYVPWPRSQQCYPTRRRQPTLISEAHRQPRRTHLSLTRKAWVCGRRRFL
ncbi:unnamed protein product, partial [Musa banksii]